ncbi:MAG TPA: antibiotic biosynthesis monooxygenase [Thermodesulfobacteriota bacterium]|nr:antibiotic biosynthesis monooxygenase [Thermodesulfobacteriota bacterium]
MLSKRVLFLMVAALFIVGAVAGSLAFAGVERPFSVVATIKIKPGFEKEAYKEMAALIPLTHREPGCLRYDMHVNVGLEPNDNKKENPSYIMFYETWLDRESWDMHMVKPYVKRWFTLAEKMTDGVEIYLYDKLSVGTVPTRQVDNPDPKEMYTILALINIKPKDANVKDGIPDTVDRAWKEMLALIPLTHTDKSCINYDMHVALDMNTMGRKMSEVAFYENWYSYDLWKKDHMNAPYLKHWFDIAPKFVDLKLTAWRKVDFTEVLSK